MPYVTDTTLGITSPAPSSAVDAAALVFDLHRNSTHDGPGIRTTVFLKGCPLHCLWCHNPESQLRRPEVWWFEQRCIACGRCIEACPQHGIAAGSAGISIDRGACTGCQTCARVCPANAMQPLGTRRTVSDLVAEAERDRVWYEASGGGVTVSGGEPAAQPAFTGGFLAECRKRGLHTALDTCGQAPESVFADLLDHADLVLFDLKHTDEAKHRRLTGAGLKTIRANLLATADRARNNRLRLWIRTPLIPGAAAEPDVLASIGTFLRECLGGAFARWELCAFNPGCAGKYHRLAKAWAYEEKGLLGDDLAAGLLATARQSCGALEVVHLMGVRQGR